MSIESRRRYQDIAIINIERRARENAGQSKNNPYLVALNIVLASALLIAIGYIACLKTGILAPPSEPCCFGIIELDFDFGA